MVSPSPDYFSFEKSPSVEASASFDSIHNNRDYNELTTEEAKSLLLACVAKIDSLLQWCADPTIVRLHYNYLVNDVINRVWDNPEALAEIQWVVDDTLRRIEAWMVVKNTKIQLEAQRTIAGHSKLDDEEKEPKDNVTYVDFVAKTKTKAPEGSSWHDELPEAFDDKSKAA